MKEFLRDGTMTLVQSESNKILKERKRLQRQKRAAVVSKEKAEKRQDLERRKKVAAEVPSEDSSPSSKSTKEKN